MTHVTHPSDQESSDLALSDSVAGEYVILRPIYQEIETPRGVERRFGSYGRLLTAGTIIRLEDGALRR